MNILVIENEIYLAQKMIARLQEDGHNCEHIDNENTAIPDTEFDIVLLSTAFKKDYTANIISKYKKSAVIIVLASYISNDTVNVSIQLGAQDYVIKPFIMEDLVKKIYHYVEYRQIKSQLDTLRSYIKIHFKDINTKQKILKTKFPVLIETNYQKIADKLVFDLAKRLKKQIKFISLSKPNWKKLLEEQNNSSTMFYFTEYQLLKSTAKSNFLELIKDKKAIVSTLEKDEDFPYGKLEVYENSMNTNQNFDLMTINEYVKLMVTTYQDKYPDTKLSERLGISRKSLWEKRKKLGIEKKK